MSATTRFIKGAFDRFIASKIRSKGYVDMSRYLHHEKGGRCSHNNKEKIKKQLEMFSINRATLLPEMENIAEYLRTDFLEMFKVAKN